MSTDSCAEIYSQNTPFCWGKMAMAAEKRKYKNAIFRYFIERQKLLYGLGQSLHVFQWKIFSKLFDCILEDMRESITFAPYSVKRSGSSAG
ncbi:MULTISPECIES: hypothetical protein [Chitinophagaceae]